MKYLFYAIIAMSLAGCKLPSGHSYLELTNSQVLEEFEIGDNIRLVKNKYGEPFKIAKLSSNNTIGVYSVSYKSFREDQVSDKKKQSSRIIFLIKDEIITDIWFRY